MGDTQNPRSPGRRPISILVVDDSATMRMLIKRVASLCDVPIAHVYEAANGAEAIEVLEANEVDALFTDVNMPVMTGPELLRELGKHERYRSLTRVIISTDGSSARREEMRDLNVRLFIEKPFRPEVMRDVFSEITAVAGVR